MKISSGSYFRLTSMMNLRLHSLPGDHLATSEGITCCSHALIFIGHIDNLLKKTAEISRGPPIRRRAVFAFIWPYKQEQAYVTDMCRVMSMNSARMQYLKCISNGDTAVLH